MMFGLGRLGYEDWNLVMSQLILLESVYDVQDLRMWNHTCCYWTTATASTQAVTVEAKMNLNADISKGKAKSCCSRIGLQYSKSSKHIDDMWYARCRVIVSILHSQSNYEVNPIDRQRLETIN